MTIIKRGVNWWINRKQRIKARSKTLYSVVQFLESLLGAFIIAMVLRQFIVQSSLVFSPSMVPTMNVDDRLIVNKLVYHFNVPDRGDIVLFDSPFGDGKQYVKRLIGLPGDQIHIERGIVYINGNHLIIPGVTILRDYSRMDAIEIPDNHYFMMGDNRSNSLDSRYFGVVPHDELIGEALFTYWPINRIRWIR